MHNALCINLSFWREFLEAVVAVINDDADHAGVDGR